MIGVDHQACILCDRCVRACDDIQGNDVPAPAPSAEVTAPGSTPLLMAQERELRAKLKELRDHIVKNAEIPWMVRA